MSGNSIGKIFTVTTFGSSHGTALGAVIDGCPAGLELSAQDIQLELNKRRPGTSQITTSRNEKDQVKVVSGIFEGQTDGTPITALVYNADMNSSAYENIKDNPRPGHGDYTWKARYGTYDYRGGGRGSGRVTIGHVIGGAVAKKLLSTLKIKVISHVTQVGRIKANSIDVKEIETNINQNSVRCADLEAAERMEAEIIASKKAGDSIGGIVETIVLNAPAGLGDPVFGKLDAELTGALMGIGSVKGVEIGLGFKSAELKGSEMNDEFYIDKEEIKTKTNHSGGILGGITTGMPINIRMAVKPTPSISLTQKTVDTKSMQPKEILIHGRHDPCICPRITPVAEATVSMILVDQLIRAGYIDPCKL
jgi:chorismate synthase